MARVRVAVIMGGRSSEHDISVASARSVVDALDPERYDVRAVEIGQDGRWQLEPGGAQAQLGEGGELLPVPADGSPSGALPTPGSVVRDPVTLRAMASRAMLQTGADGTRAEALLGYRPEISIEDGLADQAAWVAAILGIGASNVAR